MLPCWDVGHWCATSNYSTLKTQMMMMMMMRRCKHSARPWRERETGRLWNVEAAADTNEDEFRLRNVVLYLPGHHQRQWIRLQDRHLVRTAVALLLFLSRSQLSSLTFIIVTRFHHRHWSSIVHGCWLSATELFRSPLLVSGTFYNVASAPSLRVFCNCPMAHRFGRSFPNCL